MAHDERAIRLWADHLAFSMIYRGGVYRLYSRYTTSRSLVCETTPWRDLPVCYGPRTTCYNRFVRWRKAGVWDRIMDALAAAHDAAVQMIDTSIVRVHQHVACVARNRSQSMGRSRGENRLVRSARSKAPV